MPDKPRQIGEKQASSEIAQSHPIDESRKRFLEAWRKSGYADMSTWREISWDLYQAAERDTRERVAQQLEAQVTLCGLGSLAGRILFDVAERIRGKE